MEYAIDIPNQELVFQREFLMPETDPPKTVGGIGGHAEPLDNGDWVISWSNPIRQDPPPPMPNTAMHVDALTGTAKLTMTLQTNAGVTNSIRGVMVSPVALARSIASLTATLPASDATSVFHTGATGAPQVVVAFNRPVVAFDETSPSLSVSGATVASVSAHLGAGEPAHAYLVTLTPAGDGAITFSLVTGEACADGGICTADGTPLSEVPATASTIPARSPPALARRAIASTRGRPPASSWNWTAPTGGRETSRFPWPWRAAAPQRPPTIPCPCR